MIVANVNLIAYLLLGGTDPGLAQQVLEKDPTWAAPVLWRGGFRNILTAYPPASRTPRFHLKR